MKPEAREDVAIVLEDVKDCLIDVKDLLDNAIWELIDTIRKVRGETGG